MRFLCLPGAFCNAKTFHAQLGPFCNNLEADKTASFFFTQGTIPNPPPIEFEGYFGPPPNFTFLEINEINLPPVDQIDLRNFPKCETPEATMRALIALVETSPVTNLQPVLDRLIGILDTESDITGVIGYSEGTISASTVIVEEDKRFKENGRLPHLKYAVFIHGWPPVDSTTGRPFLSDEAGEVIFIPTCHVVSVVDPYLDGSMALYNVCAANKAELFDHGGGHLIPREPDVVAEWADMVRNAIKTIES